MTVTIGYFAEPSTWSIRPAELSISIGEFATHEEALVAAHHAANRLQAHSFVIEFADGTSERHVRDGDGWMRDDA